MARPGPKAKAPRPRAKTDPEVVTYRVIRACETLRRHVRRANLGKRRAATVGRSKRIASKPHQVRLSKLTAQQLDRACPIHPRAGWLVGPPSLPPWPFRSRRCFKRVREAGSCRATRFEMTGAMTRKNPPGVGDITRLTQVPPSISLSSQVPDGAIVPGPDLAGGPCQTNLECGS
jgi:hypothetical protein